jgi:hypothetical protein
MVLRDSIFRMVLGFVLAGNVSWGYDFEFVEHQWDCSGDSGISINITNNSTGICQTTVEVKTPSIISFDYVESGSSNKYFSINGSNKSLSGSSFQTTLTEGIYLLKWENKNYYSSSSSYARNGTFSFSNLSIKPVDSSETSQYNYNKLTKQSQNTLFTIENRETDFTLSKFSIDGSRKKVEDISFGVHQDSAKDFEVGKNGDIYIVGATLNNFKTYFRDGKELTQDEAYQKYLEDNANSGLTQLELSQQFLIYWEELEASKVDSDKSRDFANSFLLKFDENGSKVFYNIWGSSKFDKATTLTLDSLENIYISGFEDMNETDNNSTAYLKKFDKDGNSIFNINFFTNSKDVPTAITVDDNFIYIVGSTTGTFSGNMNKGGEDIFLAKFDRSTGRNIWIRQFGTSSNDSPTDIKVFEDEIYILANTSSNSGDIVFARFNKNGERKHISTFGTEKENFGEELLIDSSGNPTILGFTKGSLTNSSEDIWATEWNNLFVKKIDNLGNSISLDEVGVDNYNQKYLLFHNENHQISKVYFEKPDFYKNVYLYISEIEKSESSENLTSISLSQGWNLVSIDKALSNIPNTISIIWQFSNGNWSAYSPKPTVATKITSQNIGFTENLSSKDGTWFLADYDISLSVDKPEIEESSNNPTFPNFSGKLGWNLMGTDITIPAKALNCSEGEKGNVWKFVNGSWLLFIDGVTVSYPNKFELIEAGQGFWLQCR